MLPQREGCVKKELHQLVFIGFMVNNIFPARVGEAVRAALLWKRNRFTVAESVGSLLVERFLDVLVFVVFLFLPILVLPQLASLHRYAVLLTAGFCSVLLCFAVYAFRPQLAKRVGSGVAALLPKPVQNRVVPIGRDLLSNLDWLFSVKRTLAVAVLSFLTLLCQIGMLQTLGFGLEYFGFFSNLLIGNPIF